MTYITAAERFKQETLIYRVYHMTAVLKTHLCVAGSSMRLASCNSWLLVLVSAMLGRSCSSLREVSGGVWEVLAVCVFEARVAGGVLCSGAKASSVNVHVSGPRSFEHGTTDMEMERPWVPVGSWCVKGLGRGLMGEKASLSSWGSELQEPESILGSPPWVKE